MSDLTKRDAIMLLVDWGAAEVEMLHPIEEIMLDLRLTASGELSLGDLGEHTRDVIFKTSYAPREKAIHSSAISPVYLQESSTEEFKAAKKALAAAVRREKSLFWLKIRGGFGYLAVFHDRCEVSGIQRSLRRQPFRTSCLPLSMDHPRLHRFFSGYSPSELRPSQFICAGREVVDTPAMSPAPFTMANGFRFANSP